MHPEAIPSYIPGPLATYLRERLELDARVQALQDEEPDVLRDACRQAARVGTLQPMVQWLLRQPSFANRPILQQVLDACDLFLTKAAPSPHQQQTQRKGPLRASPSPVPMSDRLPMPLFWIDKGLIDHYSPQLGLDGLGLYTILMRCAAHSVRPPTPSLGQVFAALGLPASTIRALLTRLVAAGVVTITKSLQEQKSIDLCALSTTPVPSTPPDDADMLEASLPSPSPRLSVQRAHDVRPDRKRADVWAKTAGRCWYCGILTNPWQDFCVDHVIPRARGGTDTLENLVPCCSLCNARKGTKTVEEFRRVLTSTMTHYTFYFEQGGDPRRDEAE